MTTAVPAERVSAVREFSRLYTKIIGLLDEGMLSTPYSLTEARILFELSQQTSVEVTTLRRVLGLDPGYLSRLLARFETDGLVVRERSTQDGRRQVIRLTAAGKDVYHLLEERSSNNVRRLLTAMTDNDQRRVVRAMDLIRTQLGERPRPDAVIFRQPRAGDLGWVVHRHAATYGQDYGWDITFEAFTARAVADFIERHDQQREAAWIAELRGEPVGCGFCMRKDATTAKLRMLLVEPGARGHGVGSRLVRECVSFARTAGYRTIELWTTDQLYAARRIYEQEGFRLVSQTPQHLFGNDLVGEDWRLEL